MIYTSDDTLTPWAALSKSHVTRGARAAGSLARRASFTTSRVLAVSAVGGGVFIFFYFFFIFKANLGHMLEAVSPTCL